MRRKNSIAGIIVYLTSVLFFVSCEKDDNSSNNVQEQVKTEVQSGTWRITKFIDSGDNETNHFAGYNFTFNNSGVLNAFNGINNYNGTWSITTSNSGDDSSNDLDFNIYFNLMNDFEDLNDDWDFVSHTSSKIELIDISGGNGGTDSLTFEKN